MFGGGSVTPLVQAGKLRALAISGRKRSPIFQTCRPFRKSTQLTT